MVPVGAQSIAPLSSTLRALCPEANCLNSVGSMAYTATPASYPDGVDDVEHPFSLRRFARVSASLGSHVIAPAGRCSLDCATNTPTARERPDTMSANS